jgi:hypothetical protein
LSQINFKAVGSAMVGGASKRAKGLSVGFGAHRQIGAIKEGVFGGTAGGVWCPNGGDPKLLNLCKGGAVVFVGPDRAYLHRGPDQNLATVSASFAAFSFSGL